MPDDLSEQHANSYRLVRECVDEVIAKYFPDDLQATLGLSGEAQISVKKTLYEACLTDAREFAKRDPASGGSIFMVRHAYGGFHATVAYRLSHEVNRLPVDRESGEPNDNLRIYARKISEYVKRDFRVEIHPGAKIGPGLLLDHARGVVIGETAVIGKNCCLLQGVVLGAVSVNTSSSSKRRHPTLGNDVTVGGNALVLGPITVGNNVFIGPHAIVRDDVPDNVRVTLQAYVQYSRYSPPSPQPAIPVKLFGITPHAECYDSCIVYGVGLANISRARLIDPTADREGVALELDLESRDDRHLRLKARNSELSVSLAALTQLWLELSVHEPVPPILIRHHDGLRYFLEQLAAGRS